MFRFLMTFLSVYTLGMLLIGMVFLISSCQTPDNNQVPTTRNPATTSVIVTTTSIATTTSSDYVYYRSCDEIPGELHAGDPGYRSGLDRDHDGVACNK